MKKGFEVTRSLEWHPLFVISRWRLKDSKRVVASLNESWLGDLPHFFFRGMIEGRRFEIRYLSGNEVTKYGARPSPNDRVLYSIRVEQYLGEWKSGKEKIEWGRLEHGHGLYESPTLIRLGDGRQYSIASSDLDRRRRRFSIIDEGSNMRILAITKRSKKYGDLIDLHPGTFEAIQFEVGDPELLVLATVTFAFTNMVGLILDSWI